MRTIAFFATTRAVFAQEPPPPARNDAAPAPATAPAAPAAQPPGPQMDVVLKAIDDWMWVQRLSDIADVDKVKYPSLPPTRIPNRTAPGAGNPVVVHAYTFIPKKIDRTKKHPLLGLIHGGVHSNFSTSDARHILREMLDQGYCL